MYIYLSRYYENIVWHLTDILFTHALCTEHYLVIFIDIYQLINIIRLGCKVRTFTYLVWLVA